MKFDIGATKEILVKRLLRVEKHIPNSEELLTQLLTPIGSNCVSPVAEHYRQTFNYIDRFDTYLGHIPWPYQVRSLQMIVLISCVRVAIINSAHLFNELCTEFQREADMVSLKQFVSIASELLLKR